MEKCFPPERLEGARIYLAKHRLAQAPIMFEMINQDRERLGKFLPWVKFTREVNDSAQYIHGTLEEWDSKNEFNFSIFKKEDETYLGNISAHAISWDDDCCEIGYWILGKYEGQGYMSEATLVLDGALFSLGFNRIEIRCSSANERSASVPRRCGYTLEGRLKKHRRESLGYRDTLIFAKVNDGKTII